MARKRKFKYNPFKMWGSWIGLVIGAYCAFGTWVTLINCRWGGCSKPYGLAWIINYYPTFGIILTLVLGFIGGWGIHSLIRKLRKR